MNKYIFLCLGLYAGAGNACMPGRAAPLDKRQNAIEQLKRNQRQRNHEIFILGITIKKHAQQDHEQQNIWNSLYQKELERLKRNIFDLAFEEATLLEEHSIKPDEIK